MTTLYDVIEYPSTICSQGHPERLGVLAKLAGLDPVPPETARMLEVGGGDCLNMIALAATYPLAQTFGFDLSEVAIAKGQRLVDAAGLGNITLAALDICKAAERYPARSMDYVIIHGVYAWVPPHVREGIWQMLDHVLSDRGVAYISYNCMPGGHVRQAVREMLLLAIADVTDPQDRIAAAYEFLEQFAKPVDGQEGLAVILRETAESMLKRQPNVLFHDELGECFYPQRLGDVVADGARHGLRFLTDAGRNLHLDGLLLPDEPEPDDPDRAVLMQSMFDDHSKGRYFRQTAFVRAEQPIARQLDYNRIDGLYVTSRLRRTEGLTFTQDDDVIELANPQFADTIERVVARSPQHTPVADLGESEEEKATVVKLFAEWYINLHLSPAPFVAQPGEMPVASPLARAQIAMGDITVNTLDHRLLKVAQPEMRKLLALCDGTRTAAQIASETSDIPAAAIPDALRALAGQALILR